jgi:hypothetical protein
MNINFLPIIVILYTTNITLNAQQFIDVRIELTGGLPDAYIQSQNLRTKRLALSGKEGRFHQFMMPDDNITLIHSSIKDFEVRFDSLTNQLRIIAKEKSIWENDYFELGS